MKPFPVCLFFLAPLLLGAGEDALRPVAVPLVTHDPYFSVWSMGDRLAGDDTRHWTGAPHPLTALLRADGKTYRLMGKNPADVPPLPQVSLQVLPTRTIYEFKGAGLFVTMTFLSPVLPDDLDLLSRPVTYISWELRSLDTKDHSVSIYFDAAAELTVDKPDQPVAWSRFKLPGLSVLRMGSEQQPVLAKTGNDRRIDWGYLYIAAPRAPGLEDVATDGERARSAFLGTGSLPDSDDLDSHVPWERKHPVLTFRLDADVAAGKTTARHVILAYDDLYSIEYFHRRLRPYWRRQGANAGDLLRGAERDCASIAERARAFDEELMADLRRAGGEKYARLCALAYRQVIAAHKLAVDADGTPLFFSKETFSGGFIATVDVTYPTSPFFLLLNPSLVKASLRPVLAYAAMERWPWPYAPHDLGMYPHANGQLYGGGEKSEYRQMPVEECGNMLLLALAIARAEGNARFAEEHWPLLAKWAAYLRQKGLDPENQLSTDDFLGHLAHQANLSLKAILSLGAYGSLCEMTGRKQEAAAYREIAAEYARQWISLAGDGDHYRLAFDVPGSWSQKYNLVWDRLLGLQLFPPDVARKEVAYYLTRQDPYGLPVDSRKPIGKVDWTLWSATLAESAADFETLVSGVYRFIHETPNRVPFPDGYWTLEGKQRNYQARSVVGGIYIKMLADPAIWAKWARRVASHEPARRP